MKSLEFFFKVLDGAPLQIVKLPGAPSANHPAYYWPGWAVSGDAYGPYPAVLMHIYYHGDRDVAIDAERDRVNACVVDYVGHWLAMRFG